MNFFIQNTKKYPAFYLFILTLIVCYFSIVKDKDVLIPTQKILIQGVILEKPTQHKNRYRTSLKIKKISFKTGNKRTGNEKTKNKKTENKKIFLNILNYRNNLNKNDEIFFETKLKNFRNFQNPNNFNYERYMREKGFWGYAYVKGEKIKIIYKAEIKTKHTQNIREKFSIFLDKNIKNKNTKSILKAITIGEKKEIDKNLREKFTKTGSSHLLAISGLHIGIIGFFSFVVALFFLKHLKILRDYAILRKTVLIFSILPILFYGTISGFSNPTQRAVIMAICFISGFILEKEYNVLNTLFLSAILILFINPYAIFSVSFQFSYIAVFFIIFGMKNFGFKTLQKTLFKRLSFKFLNFILVSFFAIMGTLPISMYYFHQFSTVGILSNIILIPLIGFFALPLSILSFLFLNISVKISTLLIILSGFFMDIAINVISFFANLPFPSINTIIPTIFEVMLFYMFFLLTMTLLKNTNKKKIFAFIFLVSIIFFDVGFWTYYRFFNPNLQVSIIDVKNGSASLIELPKTSKCILVDGGGFSNSNFDVGKNVIAPFLLGRKIKTIETIILSHPNADHLNGLLYIMKNFNVKKVISNNEKTDILTYKEFLNIIEKENIQHPLFNSIKRDFYENNVRFEIVHPRKNFLKKINKNNRIDLNNNSIVIKLSYNNSSILITGDIEKKAEKDILKLNEKKIKSTILISPHHGSNTSSTLSFLKKVNPKIIIVSSGKNIERGIAKAVFERYKKLGAKIYSTKDDGAIFIKIGKKDFRIETFK